MQFMEDQAGKPFDPGYSLMQAVANVICGITFGEGEDTANPDLERLLKLNAHVIANADDAQLTTILDFFPWARYLPLKVFGRYLQPIFEIHDIARKFFRKSENNFDPSAPVNDFISSLLHAKQQAESESDEGRVIRLSEDYFVITIEDMFLAGYETTSTTLKWVIAFLVNNPKLQEDLQCELDEVLAGRKPSLNDRPNLPLIQATIIETLRIANILPLAVPHYTLTDTTLCGYRVPKDTYVLANTGSIHLDPKCWENPTEFNPYRHIDKEGKLVTNQGNFYPFGAGRRVCAGEALAKIELFLFISWMVQKFTFVGEGGHPPKTLGGFIQFPSAYKIRAIRRQ